MSVDILDRLRALEELRGHPHPGQRFKHGWIPVGVTADKLQSHTAALKRFGDSLRESVGKVETTVDWKGAHFTAHVKGRPVTVDVTPLDAASLALAFVPGGELVAASRAAIIANRIRKALGAAKAVETVAHSVRSSEVRHRELALLGIVEARGHPHPGQKFHHGWVPVSVEAVAEILTPDEAARDYGDEMDRVELPNGVAVVARSEGMLTVQSEGGDTATIHAAPSPAEADGWADYIDEGLDLEAGEQTTEDGIMVARTDSGLSIRFPEGGEPSDDPDDHDGFDLTDDGATDFAQALRDMGYITDDHTSVPEDTGTEEPPGDETPIPDDLLIRHRSLMLLGVEVRAIDPKHPHYGKGVAGGKGGEFRPLKDIIMDALTGWGGEGDPLAEYSQPQLKKVATDLGLNPPKGMRLVPLKGLILSHARERNGLPDAPFVPAPAPSKRTPRGAKKSPSIHDAIGTDIKLYAADSGPTLRFGQQLQGDPQRGREPLAAAEVADNIDTWVNGPDGPLAGAAAVAAGREWPGVASVRGGPDGPEAQREVAILRQQAANWTEVARRLRGERRRKVRVDPATGVDVESTAAARRVRAEANPPSSAVAKATVGGAAKKAAPKPKSHMAQMSPADRKIARELGVPDDHPLALLAQDVTSAVANHEPDRARAMLADLAPDDVDQIGREIGLDFSASMGAEARKDHIIKSLDAFGWSPSDSHITAPRGPVASAPAPKSSTPNIRELADERGPGRTRLAAFRQQVASGLDLSRDDEDILHDALAALDQGDSEASAADQVRRNAASVRRVSAAQHGEITAADAARADRLDELAKRIEAKGILDTGMSDEAKRIALDRLGVPDSDRPAHLRTPTPAPKPAAPTDAERKAAGYPDPQAGIDEDAWAGMSYSERLAAIVAARPGGSPAVAKVAAAKKAAPDDLDEYATGALADVAREHGITVPYPPHESDRGDILAKLRAAGVTQFPQDEPAPHVAAHPFGASPAHMADLADVAVHGFVNLSPTMTGRGRQRNQRLDELSRRGLVRRRGDAYYITDRGRAELAMEQGSVPAPAKKAAPRAAKAPKESVLGGPMDEYESALQGKTAAELKRIADELNVAFPRETKTPRQRIRHILQSLDDHKRRQGDRPGVGRARIPAAIEAAGGGGVGPKAQP